MSGWRPPRRSPRDWQAIGTATGLGFSVVISLILCIGSGVLLDQWLGTAPWLTLVGVVLGLATAGYLLYELVSLGRPTRPGKRRDGGQGS